jgi:hypothetical protein
LQTGSLLDPSLFEQIFHLYSRLAESSKDANESGLGFVDPASPLITVRLHVPDESAAEKKAKGKGKSKGRHRVSYAEDKQWMKEQKVLEWEIEQDIAGLKGRKGDTGAVLWRARWGQATSSLRMFSYSECRMIILTIAFAGHSIFSIHLARLILASPHRSPLSSPLFDPTVFIRSNLRVLELGAGTGFLSVALHSSLCGKEGEWTVTDQKSLLTLIGRNLEMNGVHHEFGEGENRNEREKTNTRRLPGKNTAQSTRGRVTVQELDWLEVEHTWKEDLHSRLRGRRPPTTSGDSASPYDLILAVDCIFNESLILPFLRTIDHLSTAFAPQDHREQEGTKGDWSGDVNVKGSSGTVVMVVCELRSSEVMREFLGAWVDFQREGAVDHGDQTGRWNIWRVGEEALSPESGDQDPSKVDKGLGNGRYVVWVAWKE